MTDPGPFRSQAKRLAAQGKPPETSRELAKELWFFEPMIVDNWIEEAAALIDAYVLEREAKIIKSLQWALKEGQKGFHTVEEGQGTWYYCRFCHAVAGSTDKLNHEDSCEYWHVKKIAAVCKQPQASQPNPREKPR